MVVSPVLANPPCRGLGRRLDEFHVVPFEHRSADHSTRDSSGRHFPAVPYDLRIATDTPQTCWWWWVNGGSSHDSLNVGSASLLTFCLLFHRISHAADRWVRMELG